MMCSRNGSGSTPTTGGGCRAAGAGDSVSGSAGDPVTVASASIAAPNVEGAAGRDPGLVNTAAGTGATGEEATDEDGKPTAKRGRPSADEKKTLVEEAVKAGMSRA